MNRSDSVLKITEESIQTIPSTNLTFPAITVCREIPYNPDEYVRAVFDNFQMACNESDGCKETQILRKDFQEYLCLNTVRSTYT